MKDQSVEDLIVFRNADSFGKRARKFDFAFPRPGDDMYADISLKRGFTVRSGTRRRMVS